MNILFYGNMSCHIGKKIAWLENENYNIVYMNENSTDDELASVCQTANILISMVYDHRFISESIEIILVPGIGIDKIDPDLVPKDVPVLISAGHEMAIAEYILSQVITYYRKFTEISTGFKKDNDWTSCSRLGGIPQKQLSELTIGVIGAGLVGRNIIETLQPFDAKLKCMTRYPYTSKGNVTFYQRDKKNEFISDCDVVIVACSSDDSSKKLIEKNFLKMMKKEAMLINIARADCIDYEALYYACKCNDIGCAVIDVWPNYPQDSCNKTPPADLDFNSLDNVFMTPHISAWTNYVINKRADIIQGNIRLHSKKFNNA